MTFNTRPEGVNAAIRTGLGGLRGTGAYFPDGSISVGKFFVAEILSFESSRVSVDKTAVPAHPTAGAWLNLTVTFNPQGDPVTNLDGTILARYDTEVIDGWATLRHFPLEPNSWVHYSLFAQYDFGGGDLRWERVATEELLIPGNFGYGETMFNRLPRWYQDADFATTERLTGRFMNAVGAEVDITRSWIETLGNVWDPSKIPARLLESLSTVLGLPYERSVGDPRVRKLLSNLIYLRKLKGTREAIEGYMSALSGYSVLVDQGPNISLTVEDAEFREGTVGNWVPDADSTIAVVTPAGAGAPPSPQGVLEVQRTSAAGITSAASGAAGVTTQMIALDDGVGREFYMTVNAKGVAGALALTLSVEFCDVTGAVVGTVAGTSQAITADFGRVGTGWLAAPDTARYARLIVASTASVNPAEGFRFGQVMFVDRRWRPDLLPGYLNSEPFAGPGSANYTEVDFYESPRTVWLNVFPQRTNFAVNSDFALNNLPADGWTVTPSPTYDLLPRAYADYDAVVIGEASYDDLVSEFNSLTPDWTLTFNTVDKRLEMASSPASPHVAQARSKEFPALEGGSYSARVEMQGVEADSKATLRIQWMAKSGAFDPLEIDGVPQVSQGATFDLRTGNYINVGILNAIAPEGAAWGRLIIESFNIVAHTTYVNRVLIEDAPKPGPYFNGDDTDGAPGDFGYTGTAGETYSVYYLNYTAVTGATTNRLLTAARDIIPMHLNDPRITTAYSGLYD